MDVGQIGGKFIVYIVLLHVKLEPQGITIVELPIRRHYHKTQCICINVQLYILTHSALSWNLSLAENLANLSLQDRATKWHYYQSGPSTHPPIHPATHPALWICIFAYLEYLCNQRMDLSQILNFSLGDHTIIAIACIEDNLKWKTTSNY